MFFGSHQPGTKGATMNRPADAARTAPKRTGQNFCTETTPRRLAAALPAALKAPLAERRLSGLLLAVDHFAHVFGQHLRVGHRVQEVDDVPDLLGLDRVAEGRHAGAVDAGMDAIVDVQR